MEPQVRFDKSAFKHGYSEGDIIWTLKTFVYEAPLLDAGDDTYIVVGYDRAGNPLEAAFRELDDGTLYVFHAMKAQKKWREKAGI
jgi:hypothetical protein